ncbi:Alkaline phosphatase D precursor [Rosistilla carotiformis]|uniref:Alkaline phosphatase D n=1 Tax=Rosistilla carotiformis TaxID=2528017 RepID=A0A518JSW2_9BACT|nr:alkaline phosphatase D family protein [Rosistilla carotiformis]QDV68618.1 Alkaline phosphatase D precursor [Rosistilla carotiformis]
MPTIVFAHRYLLSCVVLSVGALALSAQPPSPAAAPKAGMGIMVGELTSASANVQLRLTSTDTLVERDLPGLAGTVSFQLYKEGSDQVVGKQILKASEHRDFIARATFKSLIPGTRYRCETELASDTGAVTAGPVARFKTLPATDATAEVRFVVVTGMNYAKFHGDSRIDLKQHRIENNTNLPAPYAGVDKHLGYPALASILKLQPNFFVGTGDNVYYDTPDKPRAKTVVELRQKWHEQFVQPRFRDLFAAVPTYWMIDDHDYRQDDCDNSGNYHPLPVLGRRLMLEQLPVAQADDADAKTYRTFRIGKDLQIWLTENRMYRSDNAMEDGPEKTIWGAEQKAWLMKTLEASDATFKLLISPTPMVGPDDKRKTDNHTNIGGFRTERDQFFAWLKTKQLDKGNFFVICGDRHWQYHAIDPSGIEEFSCGALVDANSRLGRKAGDPASTDSDGLIKQPYLQDPRSGGFLEVVLTPAGDSQPSTLNFRWRDELGVVLHETSKPAK